MEFNGKESYSMTASSYEFRKKDTIPQEVKQHFWTDKSPPNLNDYDAIGFDADHCMVKYNVKDLVQLLVKVELEDLYEMGYPKEIMEYNTEETAQMCLNACIYDIDTGLIIQLVEGKEIIRAMKGCKVLSRQEIHAIYGNPPIFDKYHWPNTGSITEEGGYMALFTFFDIAKVAIVLSAVDLKERGLLNKSYYDIACDIRTIVLKEYMNFTDEEVFPIATYGRFFPEMVKNPSKYIQYQPYLRPILTHLRNNGKKLFLATNSHTEYTSFIMSATLGEDWQDFFDIVSSYCRKPIFFWDSKVLPPFFELDTSKGNFKGKQIMHPEHMKCGKIYTEGNSRLLTQFFEKLIGKQNIKVAYFGDQYISDVQASSTNPGWDGFAVIEEMMHHDDSFAEGIDPKLYKYDKFWGPNYFAEAFGTKFKRNYFLSCLEDSARYALPLVKNMRHWL